MDSKIYQNAQNVFSQMPTGGRIYDICVPKILRIAVLLVGLFVDFGAELDLRSAVALKQGIPLGVSRCFFRKSTKSPL